MLYNALCRLLYAQKKTSGTIVSMPRQKDEEVPKQSPNKTQASFKQEEKCLTFMFRLINKHPFYVVLLCAIEQCKDVCRKDDLLKAATCSKNLNVNDLHQGHSQL